ncbi:MAG: iron uptake porin, partial [Microcystis panniformis]
ALGARVDNLENRAAFLEDHSFSTTTKLLGEAIFVVANAFQGAREGSNTVFQDRVRLRFVSSFTGKDQLNVRLDAGNARRFNLGDGTPEATQSFNLVPSLDNNVNIGWLAYYFPIGDRISAYIGAVNGVTYDFIPTLNPYLDSGTGGGKALTVFASANPIYQIGGGAGGGFNYQLSDRWIASLGYLAGNHADPNPGSGLFNGQYAAIAQIAWLDSRSG